MGDELLNSILRIESLRSQLQEAKRKLVALQAANVTLKKRNAKLRDLVRYLRGKLDPKRTELR
jgi:cell division protein FtsB